MEEELIRTKETGYGRIVRLLYLRGEMTRMELQTELGLSKPTVLQAVKELTQAGILRSGKALASDKGRHPVTLVFQYESRLGVGVRVLPDRLEMVLANLKLIVHARKTVLLPHTAEQEHEPAFFDRLREEVDRFVAEQKVPPEQFCGAGFALEGENDNEVWQSAGCVTTKEEMQRHFPYRIQFGQMRTITGYAELWSRDHNMAACLIVGSHVHCVLMAFGRVINGMMLPGGNIDHLTLYPGGKKCACGRKGCVEAYCTTDRLLGDRFANLETFFMALRSGDAACGKLWADYLDNLSQLIANLEEFLQWKIVLSGELADWLRSDFELLKELVSQKRGRRGSSRLRLGRFGSEGDALGAALQVLEFALTGPHMMQGK